jgi:uncharacterized protein YraI
MRRFLLCATAAAALAVPAAAMAAVPGFAITDVNLHAGPGGVYPVVDTLPAGARVRIDGCIGRYAWCNVAWRGEWGWVPGDDLQALYRGRRVLVLDYGPEIDLPIIGFSVDTYWHRHYRHRHFYGRLHDYDHGRYAHGAAGVSEPSATTGTRSWRDRALRNGAAVQNAAPRTRSLTQTPQTRTVTPKVQSAPTSRFNAGPARPRHETTGAAPSAGFTPHVSAPAPAVASPHPAPAVPAPHPAPAAAGPGGGPNLRH